MKAFRRTRSGSIAATFEPNEVELLSRLAHELGDVLETRKAPQRDPALVRLLPDGYSRDEEASGEFRRYTEHDLVESKARNAQTLLASLMNADSGRITLDLDEQQAWLRSLTDLRLTLASRLGIQVDGDEGLGGESTAIARDVYLWLGWMQETLVAAVDR